MKTAELTGAALDWAVAVAFNPANEWGAWRPSSNWAQGGPIIEREGVAIYLYGDSQWLAHVGGRESIGPTPLIAAMRCYVASKLGDEVKISDELMGAA